jgi:hypothetical protein
MLAFYIEWHMRQALKPLLFDDEELEENRWVRDPVAPAKTSETALRKKSMKTTTDGHCVHSFTTLLEELATRTKNICSIKTKPDSPPFVRITEPTPLQKNAMILLGLFPEKST